MSGFLGMSGVTLAFEDACQQIKRYLLVDLSANTIRQETKLLGEKQAQQERTWIEHLTL
jgi:hypothetical protein